MKHLMFHSSCTPNLQSEKIYKGQNEAHLYHERFYPTKMQPHFFQIIPSKADTLAFLIPFMLSRNCLLSFFSSPFLFLILMGAKLVDGFFKGILATGSGYHKP